MRGSSEDSDDAGGRQASSGVRCRTPRSLGAASAMQMSRRAVIAGDCSGPDPPSPAGRPDLVALPGKQLDEVWAYGTITNETPPVSPNPVPSACCGSR